MKKEKMKYVYLFLLVFLIIGLGVLGIFVLNIGQKNKIFVKEYKKEAQKTKKEEKIEQRKEKRKILPYDKPLPPVPDSKEVAERFVDVNQNNVRDDVEIEIVKEYGSDRDIVEAIFADTRIMRYKLYLVENDLLTKENIGKILNYEAFAFACDVYYYDSSEFYNTKDVYGDIYDYRKISELFYNTEEREKKLNKYLDKIVGYNLGSEKVDDKICEEFFKESEKWFLN